jgi:AraC-like DNA-binding protein
MIDGARVKPELESVGHFLSGPGGADTPAVIPRNFLLFELITEGSVYAPEGNDLHGAGAIFAHVPGQSTVCRSPADGHYACMTARFRLDRLPRALAWPRVFQWTNVSEALRFSEEMLFAFHHTDLDRGVLGDLIWSQFRFRLEDFRRGAKHQAIPPVVAGAMNHMDRCYGEPLGVESLAAQFGLSASHLHAQFREHVGMTPHQHLILQRMRSARHRLVTTSDPIKSIARDVGYANTENFCRAFKKHCGLTAAAYRRKFIPYA